MTFGFISIPFEPFCGEEHGLKGSGYSPVNHMADYLIHTFDTSFLFTFSAVVILLGALST